MSCCGRMCAHWCVVCWGTETFCELGWGGGGGAREKAEQVSTEPAWPGWVELGGAGGSHSRFQGGIGVWVSVCVCISVCLWVLEGTHIPLL